MNRMIKLVCAIIALAVLQQIAFAQSLDTVWTRTYGGVDDDYGYSIVETSDNCVVIAGCERSDGLLSYFDACAIKLSDAGDLIWEKSYGGPMHNIAYSIKETADMGLIMAGASFEYYVGSDSALLVRTDSDGDTIWTKQYDGAFYDVIELNDGSFVAVGCSGYDGSSHADIFILKTDSMGNVIWENNIGGGLDDFGKSIILLSDGGFIICGNTYSFGNGDSDLYLIRTDEFGDILWTRTFGDLYSDFGNDVIITEDNYIIAVGTTHPTVTDEAKIYAVKVNMNGDSLWEAVVGNGHINLGNSVVELNSGGFLINGTIKAFGADFSDGYLVFLDENGEMVWSRTYGGYYSEEGSDLLVTSNGTAYLSGITESYGSGGPDIYALKLTSGLTGIYDNETKDPEKLYISRCYPNPFNNTLAIEYMLKIPSRVRVEIYDLLGRNIKSIVNEFKAAGEHRAIWDAENQSSGIYFYKMQIDDLVETKKMILLR